MNALGFFAIVGGGVFCFLLGYVTKYFMDKPIYIPESMAHDSKQFPHHVHDHDKPK